MDENHLVLDVTYGNFSCRLEGFDDSVETMKVVVSFFHDLAGHDRFMDVEPLAPDMDTLARLTEEQTGQPVEAEGYDNKVSLRVRTEVVADEVTEEPIEEIEDTFVEDLVEEDEADDLSNVAEKLKQMRAAAAQKVPSASAEFAEDLGTAATAAAANPLSQRLSELVQRTTQAEEEADVTPEASAELYAADDDFGDTAVSEDAVDEETAEEEDVVAEDEQINVFSEAEDEVTPQAAENDTFVLNDPVEAPEATASETDAVADTDVAEAEVEDIDVVAPEVAVDAVTDAEDALDDEELDAFMAEEDEAQAAAAAAQDAAETELEEAESSLKETDGADAENVQDAARETSSPLVLTPADQAKDEAEEDHDDYNDDDEFDLEAEVAKVEAELAARQGTDLASRGLPRHVEDAMSRIMSQTDQHLNQPENRRHRDAFAQLKAAVAATEAARQLGDKGADKKDPDEVFKDDLGAHGDHEKGERTLSTPLKLVKSQEVEPEETAPEGEAAEADTSSGPSARLREIATMKEAQAPEEVNDFAAFVASHGATDLADRLEAAGAYICFVEGDADFSRPQVMKLVQSAASSEITREDGLRSFGRLLRQARLVKLPNGRFQVSENTQFRPDDYRAAQG
ncbi:MAG: hypothetical protein AAFP98_08160 [Pseudomonadota bacterium]